MAYAFPYDQLHGHSVKHPTQEEMTTDPINEVLVLLKQYKTVPSDQSYFLTEDGTRIEIERDPESSIDFRLFKREYSPEEWSIVCFSPTATRPPSYPDNIPFILSQKTYLVKRLEKDFFAWFLPKTLPQLGYVWHFLKLVVKNPRFFILLVKYKRLDFNDVSNSEEIEEEIAAKRTSAMRKASQEAMPLSSSAENKTRLKEIVDEILSTMLESGWEVLEQKGTESSMFQNYSLEKDHAECQIKKTDFGPLMAVTLVLNKVRCSNEILQSRQ